MKTVFRQLAGLNRTTQAAAVLGLGAFAFVLVHAALRPAPQHFNGLKDMSNLSSVGSLDASASPALSESVGTPNGNVPNEAAPIGSAADTAGGAAATNSLDSSSKHFFATATAAELAAGRQLSRQSSDSSGFAPLTPLQARASFAAAAPGNARHASNVGGVGNGGGLGGTGGQGNGTSERQSDSASQGDLTLPAPAVANGNAAPDAQDPTSMPSASDEARDLASKGLGDGAPVENTQLDVSASALSDANGLKSPNSLAPNAAELAATPTIPDASTTFLLLGGSLVGLAVVRRKFAA